MTLNTSLLGVVYHACPQGSSDTRTTVEVAAQRCQDRQVTPSASQRSFSLENETRPSSRTSNVL